MVEETEGGGEALSDRPVEREKNKTSWKQVRRKEMKSTSKRGGGGGGVQRRSERTSDTTPAEVRRMEGVTDEQTRWMISGVGEQKHGEDELRLRGGSSPLLFCSNGSSFIH